MTDPLIDALVNALADRIMQRLLDDDGPLVTKMRDVFIDGLRSHELADRDDIDNAVNKALEEHEREHHDTTLEVETQERAIREGVAECLREMARSV